MCNSLKFLMQQIVHLSVHLFTYLLLVLYNTTLVYNVNIVVIYFVHLNQIGA